MINCSRRTLSFHFLLNSLMKPYWKSKPVLNAASFYTIRCKLYSADTLGSFVVLIVLLSTLRSCKCQQFISSAFPARVFYLLMLHAYRTIRPSPLSWLGNQENILRNPKIYISFRKITELSLINYLHSPATLCLLFKYSENFATECL